MSATNKGGYQIISLENKDVFAAAHYIKGIYEKVKSSRKPILFTDIVVDEHELQDVFLPVYRDGSNFMTEPLIYGEDSTVVFIIQNNDIITTL